MTLEDQEEEVDSAEKQHDEHDGIDEQGLEPFVGESKEISSDGEFCEGSGSHVE